MLLSYSDLASTNLRLHNVLCSSQHLQKVEGGEAAEGVRLDTLDLVGVYKSAEIVSN